MLKIKQSLAIGFIDTALTTAHPPQCTDSICPLLCKKHWNIQSNAAWSWKGGGNCCSRGQWGMGTYTAEGLRVRFGVLEEAARMIDVPRETNFSGLGAERQTSLLRSALCLHLVWPPPCQPGPELALCVVALKRQLFSDCWPLQKETEHSTVKMRHAQMVASEAGRKIWNLHLNTAKTT